MAPLLHIVTLCSLPLSAIGTLPQSVGATVILMHSEPTMQLNDRLFDAIRTRNIKSLRTALDKGASPNATFMGVPAMSYAIVHVTAESTSEERAAYIDICRELISTGADINAKTKRGITPLMLALAANNRELCKLLLQNGVDQNGSTGSGKTLLDIFHASRLLHDAEIPKLLKSNTSAQSIAHLWDMSSPQAVWGQLLESMQLRNDADIARLSTPEGLASINDAVARSCHRLHMIQLMAFGEDSVDPSWDVTGSTATCTLGEGPLEQRIYFTKLEDGWRMSEWESVR
jgi:hypothetical protein